MSVNSRDVSMETLQIANVARPGGGLDIYLESADEVIAYIRDPDEFAARHFGLTKLQYIEWISLDGAALCSERTRRGDLCRHVIGHTQLEPEEWLQRHRKFACHAHGGQK